MNAVAPLPDHDALATLLLAAGVIGQDQLRIARMEQQRAPRPLADLLLGLGFLSESALRGVISEASGRRPVDLARSLPDDAALALVPVEFARRNQLLPLSLDTDRGVLTIATAATDDRAVIDKLLALCPQLRRVECLLAAGPELGRAIERHYGRAQSLESILHELETGAPPPPQRPGGEGHPQALVRLVDALLLDAVKRDASDIHFEPEAHHLRVRCRIDGVLRQTRALHATYWPAMAVRIKVLAGLNIAETRVPQDGRFSFDVAGHAIDFRVSCMPTLHGENVVLRLLDRSKGVVPLSDLGLGAGDLAALEAMIARPEGLILVTGPTGSGKTTTLYSLLAHLNTEARSIMTLEDPVEYPMPRLRQTQVADSGRIGFAEGVRAMLRQDPDVLLIGEIRDADTAAMALRAAVTGHQVYSTLHAGSALGALPRLRELGVSPEMLAGNLIGIVAQRLVRRLCPDCAETVAIEPWARPYLATNDSTAATRMQARGCARCNFQGYRGRLALMEILPVDTGLDDLLARGANRSDLLAHAQRQGHVGLAAAGLARVRAGDTTLEELLRVVDVRGARR
ncbi:GspE/PulE family protein [Azoarcus olearius]|uniref:GspE/PulE family protein n=1 Tax=Azoarcus sp. (strain BH72) TaxID=418699 RepID=UPI000806A915|nr:GspE/PulE family protein [Azoarcus olearius]